MSSRPALRQQRVSRDPPGNRYMGPGSRANALAGMTTGSAICSNPLIDREPRAVGVTIRHFETLGSEIIGLDLSKPLSSADRDAIADALDRHLVVVARGQRLSDPELLAFSRNFGELDPPGPNPYGEPFNKEFPEINVISNVIENGRPIGGLGAGEAAWHADMTYIDIPPKAAVLHALEIPSGGGGDTYFADLYAAYEALPADLR